jgi:hypothetical protein
MKVSSYEYQVDHCDIVTCIGYSLNVNLSTNLETSQSDLSNLTSQREDNLEPELGVDSNFDEAYFASILNEAEDWGFLQGYDDFAG